MAVPLLSSSMFFSLECSVCYQQIALTDLRVLNCGHMAVCAPCLAGGGNEGAKELSKCPMCRAPITVKIKPVLSPSSANSDDDLQSLADAVVAFGAQFPRGFETFQNIQQTRAFNALVRAFVAWHGPRNCTDNSRNIDRAIQTLGIWRHSHHEVAEYAKLYAKRLLNADLPPDVPIMLRAPDSDT